MASVVESMVSAVTRDLLLILNGETLASGLARDSLRWCMHTHPSDERIKQGLVYNAMVFLAGYGIFVNISSDRLTGRVLDVLFQRQGVVPQPLIGQFSEGRYQQAQEFCRIGNMANGIRQVIQHLRNQQVP